LQENGRFAMHFITKDLRMAGYMGCAGKMMSPKNLADYYPPPNGDGVADVAANFSGAGIEGFQTSDLPISLTDTINLTSSSVVPGTDIVRITGASTVGARVSGNTSQVDANVKLDMSDANGMFEQNDYLFISDCEKADIFVATGVSSNAGIITIPHATEANIPPDGPTTENNLSKNYQSDAEVYKFTNTTYYIGYNDAGEHALFRQTLANAGSINIEELVEGVEDMQFLYGEDSDGDGTPNRYIDSAIVADWNNVVSVRIELQVRSIEDNVAAKLTAFNDHRLRRTFTTSIAIRNRV
jgi:type IV pilus assembly protein PilW